MPRQMVYTHGKLVPIHSHQGDESHLHEPNAQMNQDQADKPDEKKKAVFSSAAATAAQESMRKAFKF